MLFPTEEEKTTAYGTSHPKVSGTLVLTYKQTCTEIPSKRRAVQRQSHVFHSLPKSDNQDMNNADVIDILSAVQTANQNGKSYLNSGLHRADRKEYRGQDHLQDIARVERRNLVYGMIGTDSKHGY